MNGWKQPFLERIFQRHRPELLAFLRRRVSAGIDAADLAQQVYLRLLQARNLEEIRNPQAYLYTIAANLVREHVVVERRQAAQVDIDDHSVDQQLAEVPDWDASIDHGRRCAELQRAMATLPERWRAALLLQYQHGLTYREIADRLGVSPSMIKKYLVKGLARMRRDMADWN